MFGLKKCTEENFYEFLNSNSRYHPENVGAYLFGILFVTLIFLGIEYCYLISGEMKYQHLINMILVGFILISIFIYKLSSINKQKYAFKFQKFMIIILGIYWFIFSVIIYPAPLILLYYKNRNDLFNIIIYAMIIGLIYLIFVFIRLINLIRKGEMRKGCAGIYERLLGRKIAYLGFSVPIIVISSKLARRATIDMNNSGFNVGPLILMFIFAFIIQIIVSTLIPECIIVAYCKFRFESFNFSYEQYLAKDRKRKKRTK